VKKKGRWDVYAFLEGLNLNKNKNNCGPKTLYFCVRKFRGGVHAGGGGVGGGGEGGGGSLQTVIADLCADKKG